MNPVMVEVVQADRDAAADLLDGQGEFLQRVRAGIIRRGTDDKNSIVQAFARHRTRALTSDGGSGEVERAARALVRRSKDTEAIIAVGYRQAIEPFLNALAAALSTGGDGR